MKTLTLFYLRGCPYCVKAGRAIEELQAENAAYRDLAVEWIEENDNAALAASFDYYYVPSVFDGKTKLYEVDPSEGYDDIKAHLERAFSAALAVNVL